MSGGRAIARTRQLFRLGGHYDWLSHRAHSGLGSSLVVASRALLPYAFNDTVEVTTVANLFQEFFCLATIAFAQPTGFIRKGVVTTNDADAVGWKQKMITPAFIESPNIRD